MSQRDKVLEMLRKRPVCGTEFLKAYIPRYSARIHELRGAGHVIEKMKCFYDHGHQSHQVMYRLVERTYDDWADQQLEML